MATSDSNPSNKPGRGVAAPAGFLAAPEIQRQPTDSDTARRHRVKAIADILKDPLKVQALSQRVYNLMQTDFTIQRERGGRY